MTELIFCQVENIVVREELKYAFQKVEMFFSVNGASS